MGDDRGRERVSRRRRERGRGRRGFECVCGVEG